MIGPNAETYPDHGLYPEEGELVPIIIPAPPLPWWPRRKKRKQRRNVVLKPVSKPFPLVRPVEELGLSAPQVAVPFDKLPRLPRRRNKLGGTADLLTEEVVELLTLDLI